MRETVAVCLPTKGRAKQMEERVRGLLASQLPRGVELVVVLAVVAGDGESIAAANGLAAESDRVWVRLRPVGSTAVEGWNEAAACVPSADWLVLGADDVRWDEWWLVEALRVADEMMAQVIGLNDGHTDLSQYGPHYMVKREFVRGELGGCLAPAEYKSWWFDREVCERGQALGVYAPAWQARVEHWHPDWGTAAMDETYGQAWGLHDEDNQVYLRWKASLTRLNVTRPGDDVPVG